MIPHTNASLASTYEQMDIDAMFVPSTCTKYANPLTFVFLENIRHESTHLKKIISLIT